MFDQIYQRRLKADIETWIERGWVSREAAGHILTEVEKGDGRSRLPLALAAVGVICVALAIAAFIAANWDEIPRVVRLAGIALTVIAANVFAARAAAKGRSGIADLATAFAALVFIGGLSLVGQIFHLPQDWTGGALLITFGCLGAAWLGQSRLTLALAATSAITWQILAAEAHPPLGFAEGVLSVVLILAIGAHAVVFPARLSRWGVILLAYVVFGRWLLLAAEQGAREEGVVALGLSVLPAAVILVSTAISRLRLEGSAARWRDGGLLLLARSAAEASLLVLLSVLIIALVFALDGANPLPASAYLVLPVVVALTAMVAGAVLLLLNTGRDLASTLVLAAVLASVASVMMVVSVPHLVILISALGLAASIGVAMAGVVSHQGFWTLSGHGAFTVLALWLLSETIGSLLGQAVFFLVAGLVLIAMALITARSLKAASRREELKAGAA